jgi:hypothetical protein
MQTFIPYGDDFRANAMVLDRQRLGKQRVEGLQILNTLTGRSKGWRSHPAVKMWAGYADVLAQYTIAMCDHWVSLGYKDTVADKVRALGLRTMTDGVPEFLYDDEVIASHRSNLIRKLPEHYGVVWPDVSPDLPYKWVV